MKDTITSNPEGPDIYIKLSEYDKLRGIAVLALNEIAEPFAPFSRDPLTFANNTIEKMIDTAKQALEYISELER